MTDSLPTIPGTNEHSIIEFHVQRAKARRRAVGQFGPFDASVVAEYKVSDDEAYWKLTVRTRGPLGSETWSRGYHSRADVYSAFEWYLDKHPELEEVEGVPLEGEVAGIDYPGDSDA